MIVFIRTPRGMSMPCDATRLEYIPDIRGKTVFVNSYGVMCRGEVVGARSEKSELGYRPHFATCPASKEFSSRGRPSAPAKPVQAVAASPAAAAAPPPPKAATAAPPEGPPWEVLTGEQSSLFPAPRTRLKEMRL